MHEHVGEERQPLLTIECQKGARAFVRRQIARSEDRVRVPVEHRPEQPRILRRIVLEVGILDEGKIAGCLGNRSPDGGALPWFFSCRKSRICGKLAASRWRISQVPSVEQSSTMISSRSMSSGRGAARTPGCALRPCARCRPE